jgi:hypothetical protein
VFLLGLLATALAGDPDFCEVEDGSSSAFMRNSYVEMGIGSEGAFGEDSPPSSWHTRSNTGQLGFVANPQDDGWTNYYGDFFTPGSPLEGWGLKIDGVSYLNINVWYNDIVGTLEDPACDISVCRQNSSAVTWTGTVDDIDIEQQYAIADGEIYIVISTTITNNGVSPVYDLYWFRNVDPDNSQSTTGDYSTTNTIISQPDSTTDLASVEAVGSDGATLYLMASDSRARVTHGGFFNTDAEAIWDGSSYYSVVGESVTDDAAISIAIKIDSLDVGESTSFRTIYALDSAAVSSATDCAEISVIPVDTDGDSVEDDVDVCEGYDDLTDSDGDAIPDGCDIEEPVDTGVSIDTGSIVDTGTTTDTDTDTGLIVIDTGIYDTSSTLDTSVSYDTGTLIDTGVSYDTSVYDTSTFDTGITDTSIIVDTGLYDTSIEDTSVIIDTGTNDSSDTSSKDTSFNDTSTEVTDTADTSTIIDSGKDTGDSSIADTSIEDSGVCEQVEEIKQYYGGWGCSTTSSNASIFTIIFAFVFSFIRRIKKTTLLMFIFLFSFSANAQELPIYNDYSFGSFSNIDTYNNENGFIKAGYSYKYQPVSYTSNFGKGVEVNSINILNLNAGYKTGFLYFFAGMPVQTNDFIQYSVNEFIAGPALIFNKNDFSFFVKGAAVSSTNIDHDVYGLFGGSTVWSKNKFKIGYGLETQIRQTTNEYDLDLSSNLSNSFFVSYNDISIETTLKSFNLFQNNIGLVGIGWNKKIKDFILHPYISTGFTSTVGTPKINAGINLVYLYVKKPYIDPHLETIEILNKSVNEKTEQIVITIDKTKELEALIISLKQELESTNFKYKEEIDLLNEKLKQKPKFISSLSTQEQNSLIQFSAMVKNKPKLKVIIESKLDCKDPISNLYAEKYSGEYKSFLLYNEVSETNIGQETVCETYDRNLRKAKINIKFGEVTQ